MVDLDSVVHTKDLLLIIPIEHSVLRSILDAYLIYMFVAVDFSIELTYMIPSYLDD